MSKQKYKYYIHKHTEYNYEIIGVIEEKEDIVYGKIIYSDCDKSDIGKNWSNKKTIVTRRINNGIYELSKSDKI